jgi:hypothetical protein
MTIFNRFLGSLRSLEMTVGGSSEMTTPSQAAGLATKQKILFSPFRSPH